MKRPVAYLRKSRVQNDRHVSWEVQEVEIRALARRHGDSDPEILSDWGKSGRGEKTHLRPEYRRLRTMIAADEVSVVYAYSLSRLSRSLSEYASLAELCRDHHVPIRLAKDGEFDYSTVNGRAMMGMVAIFAQMEVELAQERARDTVQARRARGDHVGSAGYGKRLNGGKLEDHPDEDLAAVIDAYREAGSFSGAAKALNRDDVASKFGKAWSGTTVKRVLTTGAPAEVAGRRVEPRVRQRGTFALSRLLRCPCGQIMTGRTNITRTKYGTFGPYVSYQCYRGRFDANHPKPYAVAENVVMPWIVAEAARLRVPYDRAESDADPTLRTDLEARRGRVIDNYEDGLIDKADRDAKLLAIADHLERLDSAERARTIAPAIDWILPTDIVNDALRALRDHVELGPGLRPTRAEWTMPEWRTA